MSAVDDYLATVTPAQKEALERVHTIVADAAPGAGEGKSYGMPAFRYGGRPLIGFTASKGHLGVHPFSPEVVDAVSDELAAFALSKGTIRFSPRRRSPSA